jgi:hypothetical protein
MEVVNGLILVLVLLADQGSAPLGQELVTVLQQQFPSGIELQLDPQAGERLEAYGVSRADILADRNIGRQLSRFEPVVIIHLEDRASGEDRVLTAQLWFDGRSESYVAIAGPEGDPVPDLINGISHLLRPQLAPRGAASAEAQEQLPLAMLVEREAWQPLLGVLASREDKSPRDWYYMVLAYVRLEQRDAAVLALNEFRAAHGGHFLVAAAEAIIPPAKASEAELKTVAPQDNLLPEAPARQEPGNRGTYELTEEIEVDEALLQRLEEARKAAAEAKVEPEAAAQP